MHSPVLPALLSIHQFLPLSHASTSFSHSPVHPPVLSTLLNIRQFLQLSCASTSFFHSPVHPPVSPTLPTINKLLRRIFLSSVHILSLVNHAYVMSYGWKFHVSGRLALSGICCPNQLWIMTAPLCLSLLRWALCSSYSSANYLSELCHMKHSKDDIRVGQAKAEMHPHPLQLNMNVEQKIYSKIIRRQIVFCNTHNKVSAKDNETGKLNGEEISEYTVRNIF